MLVAEENELLTQTGPGTPMGTLLRRYWLPAMLSEELPAPDCAPLKLTLLGETLVAYRDTTGRIGLLDAYCPHRGANLFWGRNEEHGLRCVYHGWKFDVSGQCVDMPSEPVESNFKAKVTTRAYPCRELGGVIWTYMGPVDLMPQVPELEWTLVPESHRYVHKRIQHCNYLQNLEGELDSAHVSFLHQSFKTRELAVSGQSLLASTTDATPVFSVRESDYGLLVGARRELDNGSHYWRVTQFLMPSYTMIPSEPGGIINFTGAIPMDDKHMWGYTIAWHPDRPLTEEEISFIETWQGVYTELIPGSYETALNRSNNYGIDRDRQRTDNFSGIRGIREQDLPVQEDQWGPISDRTREHLGTSDLAIISLRRKLLRQVHDLEGGTEPLEPHAGSSYRVRSGAFLAPADALWYDYPEAMKWMVISR